MEYYQRLKETRKDLDINQTDVARKLNTTQQQIYKYENGKQELPVRRLKELCQYYKVSADYILGLPKDLNWPREPKGEEK